MKGAAGVNMVHPRSVKGEGLRPVVMIANDGMVHREDGRSIRQHLGATGIVAVMDRLCEGTTKTGKRIRVLFYRLSFPILLVSCLHRRTSMVCPTSFLAQFNTSLMLFIRSYLPYRRLDAGVQECSDPELNWNQAPVSST